VQTKLKLKYFESSCVFVTLRLKTIRSVRA
jgi:hypothetical protein